MEKQAAELVTGFVKEYLDGDWDKLKIFDFRELRESEKYGCPDRNFDCDDCNLMRAVYVVLWSGCLPQLTLDNCGAHRRYRGDTLNTFHTMFGRENPMQPGFFYGLEKYSPSDELRRKVRNFSKLCSNIGNYTVLPNWYAKQTTLNCYRGTNCWHDFFDRFFIELYYVLTDSSAKDAVLTELVRNNDFCFSSFQGEAGFRNFAKALLLEDFCSADGRPQNVFAMNYHWMDEKDSAQYLRDAEVYLEKTAAIIRRRAARMVDLLKQKTEFMNNEKSV